MQKFRQQIEQAAGGDAKTAETIETHTELLTWLQTPKVSVDSSRVLMLYSMGGSVDGPSWIQPLSVKCMCTPS